MPSLKLPPGLLRATAAHVAVAGITSAFYLRAAKTLVGAKVSADDVVTVGKGKGGIACLVAEAEATEQSPRRSLAKNRLGRIEISLQAVMLLEYPA
jgi:hypothetical protein